MADTNNSELFLEDILPPVAFKGFPSMVRSDILLAMTVWGEARGESSEGKLAVAWVVKNRADNPRWWGEDLKDVILKPRQFSCWNEDDSNYPKIWEPLKYGSEDEEESLLIWFACYTTALGVLLGRMVNGKWHSIYSDPTGGATHYHSIAATPAWAAGHKPHVKIGNHLFYRGIN